jgi:hypothetical protein
MASPTPYQFEAEIRLYEGQTKWHYVTLPVDIAQKIRKHRTDNGRSIEEIRVEVNVEATTWRTTLFDNKASKSYLLPLKANASKKGAMQVGDKLAITLTVLV